MTIALALGCCTGAGLWLLLRSIRPAVTPLNQLIAHLDTEGRAADAQRPTPLQQLIASISSSSSDTPAADLAVLGRTPQQHALERLATALAFATLPVAAVGLATLAGSTGLEPIAIVGTIAGAALGYMVPTLTVRSQAASRRDEVVAATSSYLDLVTVLLAGGAGSETALTVAAGAGDGWTFEQLRDALTRARTRRQSPWSGIDELGKRIGVQQLCEIASSVQLAGEQGARVATSLAAKARSMRSAQLARIEVCAQAATERMGVPMVLLFLGFLVLVGYPAFELIVAGFA